MSVKISEKESKMQTYLEERLKQFGIVCHPSHKKQKSLEMLFEVPGTKEECDKLIHIILVARMEFNN